MNTKENILNRRSIRKFKNEAVDQSLIDQIIEADYMRQVPEAHSLRLLFRLRMKR